MANRLVAFSPDGSRLSAANLNAVVQSWRTADWAAEPSVAYGDNRTIYSFAALDSRGTGLAIGGMTQPKMKLCAVWLTRNPPQINAEELRLKTKL
jgi:hypothetical protein